MTKTKWVVKFEQNYEECKFLFADLGFCACKHIENRGKKCNYENCPIKEEEK